MLKNKYFVVSDIHSFCVPLINALRDAEFDMSNPRHFLVVLGDIFDRGGDTIDVYNFLTSIPTDRLILIKGNHESLFLSLANKIEPEYHDFTNGTVRTFRDIAKVPYNNVVDIIDNWDEIVDKVKNSKIYKFIANEANWKDYIILKNKYVCTHSFVPHWNGTNWDKAEHSLWEKARWGCPYKLHEQFWNEVGGKYTLVCGHWHTSDFHERYEGVEDDYSIYRGKNLIAIDACTALTNKVNVLVV